MSSPSGPPPAPAGIAALTPREREVLALVAEGKPTAVIAAQLGIAENTVKSHCTSAYKKIGARNRVEAARFYLTSMAGSPVQEAGLLQAQIAALQARLDALRAVDQG